MTFRVMVVKKDGRPIGVRAAQINGRVVYLALRDEPEPMNWYDAVKVGIPSKEEWMAIDENFDAVNKALIKAGGEPLKKNWYWSSSEKSYGYAWLVLLDYSSLYYDYKSGSNGYVRPVLAL